MIEDVWQDFEAEQNEQSNKLENVVKDEVNEKLVKYLKQNSQHVSGDVERFLKMVNEGVKTDERVNHLGLIAFERKEFQKNI